MVDSRIRVIVFLAVVAAPVTWRCEAKEPEPPVPRSLRELRGMVRETLEIERTPGVAWAIVEADGSVETGGSGLADVASRRPATADTLFRIGSISKMFVAMTVLQLVEEGRLSLDDRLSDRAPDVAFSNPWEATTPIRVANLLEHTTGFDDLSFSEYANSVSPPLTLAQGLAFRPASRTSRWRPATRQAYCNSGPAIAARVVEHVTGRRFEDVVAERIFAPLGMGSATYFEPPANRAATLYHANGVTPFPYWRVIIRPAGSVNASSREMIAVVQMLLGRGAYHGLRVLSPGSIERMEHPATTQGARAGLREGYGLADYVTTVHGFLVRGHNGGMSGALARLGYLPDQHVGFVFMINAANDRAFTRLERQFVGYLTRDIRPPVGPAPVAVPSAIAARFAGWYEPVSPRRQDLAFLEGVAGVTRLSFDSDTLVVTPLLGERRIMKAVTATAFRPDDGPAATAVLVDDPHDGPVVINSVTTARRIPATLALGRAGVGALALVLVASVLPVAPVWVLQRMLRARLRGRRRLGVMLWPAAAALCGVLVPLIAVAAGEDALPRFGTLTPWSGACFVITLVLPFVALVACVRAFRRRPELVARFTVGYARAVAVASAVVAVGFIAAGWFAVRTWA